jgi:hypothetical protein
MNGAGRAVVTSLASGGAPGRLLAALALTWLLVMTYRRIGRRSMLLARLFAAGLIIRSVVGVALFLISYFAWPLFRGLQLGGGFWTLGLDGRTYYEIASRATERGLGMITDSLPSPLYIRVLTVWMWLFGVSPASALLLNVASYTVCAALIVSAGNVCRNASRLDVRATALALAAFSLSPALLLFGTQPLKDSLCTMFLVGAIAGGRLWWTALSAPGPRRDLQAITGALLVALGVYGIAGIRAYAALFIFVAFAASAAYNVLRGGPQLRVVDAARHAGLLIVLWLIFLMGAGPYAEPYQSALVSVGRSLHVPLVALDAARASFSASGGATSIDGPAAEADDGGGGTIDEADTSSLTTLGRLGRLVRGCAVLWIPISALRAASIVRFSGGQGLLLVTDLDTIVIDVTVIASLWLLAASVRRRGLSSATVFALALGLLLSISMAYVVTNYGTLFRLRLMAMAPFWMLPVMIPNRDHDRPHSAAEAFPASR